MGARIRSARLTFSGLLGIALLFVLSGCSGRDQTPADPKPHPKLAPVDYAWIYQAFEGHPFLLVQTVDQRAHRFPGKAVVELRLRILQPEALVKREVERIHRVHVQPDKRLQAVSYHIRGLGETEHGLLQAHWGRGYSLRWTRPERPENHRS